MTVLRRGRRKSQRTWMEALSSVIHFTVHRIGPDFVGMSFQSRQSVVGNQARLKGAASYHDQDQNSWRSRWEAAAVAVSASATRSATCRYIKWWFGGWKQRVGTGNFNQVTGEQNCSGNFLENVLNWVSVLSTGKESSASVCYFVSLSRVTTCIKSAVNGVMLWRNCYVNQIKVPSRCY